MERGIKITWTETRRFDAWLSADEARGAFGLGGTPDPSLPGRIRALAAAKPGELEALDDAAEYQGTCQWNLIAIEIGGIPDTDL